MNKTPDKFIVAIKDVKTSNGFFVQKNDIGILETDSINNNKAFFIRIWKIVIFNKNDFKVFDVGKTGDAFSKKICNICHKLLDTKEFAKNQNGINNRSIRRPSCQGCRKKLEGINLSLKSKKEWEKRKPVNKPFECPICGKKTIAGVTCKVVLDHNHQTGEVRGWICDSCNTGIGRFKDDVKLLKSAIRFLEQDKE